MGTGFAGYPISYGLIISSAHRVIKGYQEPGRQFVNLKNEDGEITTYAIDQLVAKTWMEPLENQESFLDYGKGHLWHKNGDDSDNHLYNLQWICHAC